MNSLEITSLVTGIANIISCNISDDDQLALLGAIFTQLGDTLATIIIARSICDKDENLNNTFVNQGD